MNRLAHPLNQSRAIIGEWFAVKHQRLAAEVGTQQAAKNMRKQGIPLHITLAVLVPHKPKF